MAVNQETSSTEARAEVVTKDYLRAELAELRVEIADKMMTQTRWLVGLILLVEVSVIGLFFK